MEKQILVVQIEEATVYAIAPKSFASIGDAVRVNDSFESVGTVVDTILDYGGNLIRILSHCNILYNGVEKMGGNDGDS